MTPMTRTPLAFIKRRISLYSLSPAALVLGLAASAAGGPPSAGDAGLFERLDANRNNVVAADEVSPDNRPLFDRLLRRADANHDQALSREEFLASLVPSRPEKPIEAKQPSQSPEANAVRYLLLAMDTNENSRIEKDEVPDNLKNAFEFMVERLDRNNNDALERQELSRGGPPLAQIAARYVQRAGINVSVELAKLEKKQGRNADRFEQQPMGLDGLRDPQQARQLFAQFDENGDGKLDPKEVPDPLREQIGRLTRIADRDNDGKLSEQEFITGTERIRKFFKMRQAEETDARDAMKKRARSSRNKSESKEK